jgi:hypothetical protein
LTKTRYLVVDYTRSNFSIFQTVFPDTNSISENIIPIFPPGTPKHHLSRSVIIGIIIAPIVVLVITLFFSLIVVRRRRRAALEPPPTGFTELSSSGIVELEPREIVPELTGGDVGIEMEGEGVFELSQTALFELSTDNLHERRKYA